MSDFELHDETTAPQASAELMQKAEEEMGMVPNLLRILAESPAALQSYLQLHQTLQQHAALSPQELQLVTLAVSRKNQCEYCVSVHTAMAGKAQLSDQAIQAARNGQPIEDEKLEALRAFAAAVVEKRGWLEKADLQKFRDAGYEKKHVLDVITVVAMKTLSNYTNHIAETPLDEAFRSVEWKAE